jgi:hypothetical protein
MTAHLNSGLVAQYLARTLPPADVVTLHAHLETCAECRLALAEAAMADAPPTIPLLFAEVDPHLGEEEMVAFVAGRLPEARRTDAARHVASCDLCRDSVEAMLSVRGEPARSRKPRWPTAAIAIAAVLLVAAALRFIPGRATAPPAALASLRDAGRTVQLDTAGSLHGIEGASPEELGLVKETLRRRSLPSGPHLSAEAPGVLLAPETGAPAAFSVIAPVNSRVLSDRPVFTWKPYPGAADYQVVVTNEALDPLARSGRIAATQWQPEAPLPRGVTLLWQVRAWNHGEMVSAPAPPAPPARFEIVDAPAAGRIEQLLAAPQPSHLLAAILCARAGLRDEAAREIDLLERENPGSPLVKSLRGSL